jgi:aldehyde dehydrogenase (NAD+)
LALIPLIDAIAAGNVAIVYVSPYVPTVNKILTQIIHQVFNSEYVEVVTFAQASYEEIMIPQYDYVFFTGSPRVGKIIMKQASENLIPITLELGGKSPCIVDETANINIAAKRIIRGKLMNSGQTCVAPDYLLVNKTIKAPLIKALIKSIQDFYGENVIQQRSLPKIINLQHFNRLLKTNKNQKILYGGKSDSESLIIEPTIIDIKSFKNKIMEEEIFGPILPIITFDNLEKVISDLRQLEKPLALYIFSKNSYHINQLTRSVQSGDCCINDTIMHITNEHLPFGGVGHSGMGSYHGIHGFNTFSHTRSLVVTTQKIDSSLFYPP